MRETRKLAAILVADVVGYSRTHRSRRGSHPSAPAGPRSDLIDPAITAHHGRIVKRTGDGSIVEFRRSEVFGHAFNCLVDVTALWDVAGRDCVAHDD